MECRDSHVRKQERNVPVHGPGSKTLNEIEKHSRESADYLKNRYPELVDQVVIKFACEWADQKRNDGNLKCFLTNCSFPQRQERLIPRVIINIL